MTSVDHVPGPGATRTPRSLNDRAKSKVRQQERGHEAIERRLMSLGAALPRAGPRPAAWLTQTLDDIGAVAMAHAGNLRYVWALGDRAQSRRTPIAASPSRTPSAENDCCENS